MKGRRICPQDEYSTHTSKQTNAKGAGALEGEGLGLTKVTLLLDRTTLCYRSSGSSLLLMRTAKACGAIDEDVVDEETSSGSDIYQKQQGQEVRCGRYWPNRSKKKRPDRDSGDRRQR